jgi:nitrite reductase/ring-hydroxylating ferredoxin subunit
MRSKSVEVEKAAQNGAVPSAGEFRLAGVPPGGALLVGTVAVFSVAGRLCAAQAACTHRGGPLNEGGFDGSKVTCPWHGSQFDVCTGAVVRGPAREPLKTYLVDVQGDIGQVHED